MNSWHGHVLMPVSCLLISPTFTPGKLTRRKRRANEKTRARVLAHSTRLGVFLRVTDRSTVVSSRFAIRCPRAGATLSTILIAATFANAIAAAERVTARQDRQPRGLAGVGLTAEQGNAAIDKGSQALWDVIRKEDLKDGKFGDQQEHLLAALALVHTNAHKRIPEFDAALRAFLSTVEPRRLGTYRAGLI